jgi:preprotein translocase subunit Sss1
MNKKRKKERQGAQEFDNVDRAMKDYYYFTKQTPKPKLSDFYNTSEDQKKREIGFVVVGMIVTGFIAWKVSERSERSVSKSS